MNYKAIFETAMLAGEIMAQSGAETFRVEDTMIRILKTSKLKSVEVYATTTGIVATLGDPSIEPITGVARISNRSNNLNRIYEVNQTSRDLCDGHISTEEAVQRLIAIRNKKIYSHRVLTVAGIVSALGFAGLFGGTLPDCLIAAVNGLIVMLLGRLSDNRVGNAFMTDAAKSFVLAFVTMFSARLFPNLHTEIIIIGSIMPMVPGVPITNAIRDTLQGDYNSGTARAVEAFVISLGIAVGVGLGMSFFNLIERMI